MPEHIVHVTVLSHFAVIPQEYQHIECKAIKHGLLFMIMRYEDFDKIRKDYRFTVRSWYTPKKHIEAVIRDHLPLDEKLY